jgi:hypothetical protein
MRNYRVKNLQLAGIELVLPTVLCIDGRQSKGGRTTLTVGYATGYVDTIVAPLVAEWLARHFHGRFSEHGRGAEGDLAAEAFYECSQAISGGRRLSWRRLSRSSTATVSTTAMAMCFRGS